MEIDSKRLKKVRAYISKQKQSDDAIRRMFINRPLEPHLRFLMAWADFAPIFSDIEQDYKKILNEVLRLLEGSCQLAKFAKKAIDDKEIRFHGIAISDEDNLSALAFAAEQQIVENYKQIFKASSCSVDYDDMVNEYLKQITDTILQTPVVTYKEPHKLHYGGLVLDDRSYDDMISKIEIQKNGIRNIIKGLDYGYVTEVIMILYKQSATFNNQLFRDIYDFCDSFGYIPEEQRQLHDQNTRPTAKSDYVRAAYNRLRASGRMDNEVKHNNH